MLRLESQGDIRIIRLDRAPVNALNTELLLRLGNAIRETPISGARGIVLTGVGDRYSAGLDVRELVGVDADGFKQLLGAFLDCLCAAADSSIPIVAAINGHSPAGGAVLALHCDRRIMRAGDTRIGLNEVAVGLCPGPMIYHVLSQTIGVRRAGELLTSGKMLTAAEACEIGLVDEVVPAEAVESAALAWLGRMLALPAHAYLATRRMVRHDIARLLRDTTGVHRSKTLEAMQQDWQREDVRSVLSTLLSGRTNAS